MHNQSSRSIYRSEFALRMRVFRSALIFVAIAASYFAYNNYFISSNNSKVYALFELALAIYSVGLLIFIKGPKHFNFHCNAFLFSFALVVCYGAATTSYRSGLYVWLFVFPVMSYLLLGLKQGFITTLIYLIAGVSISLWRIHLSDESIHPIAIANFSLSFLVIWAMAHTYEQQRKKAQAELVTLASTDALTGLKNRLELQDTFEQFAEEHAQNNNAMSLALVDIDWFKKLNDQFGHDIGDKILVDFARLVTKSLRETDVVFRVGGEEFCVLLPDSTADEAGMSLERLRLAVEQATFTYGNVATTITVSMGIAEYSRDADDFKALYQLADERLYHAKSHGRNQIIHTIPDPV